MDKRYLLIIIILIMGLFTLYSITNVSDTLGSASTTIGKCAFSLPQGFMVEHSDNKYVSLKNNDGVNIHIKIADSKIDNYNNTLNYLSSNGIPIISSGSINVKNIVIDSVFYNKTQYNSTTNGKENIYGVFFVFNKCGSTFVIEVTHFDYGNKNEIIQYVSFIVQSLDKNYLV